MSRQLVDTIAVIGIGLIGSSVLRAARKHNLARTLIACDIQPQVCDIAKEIGLADTVTPDLTAAVSDADLVIICVPAGAIGKVAAAIAPCLKEGAIITDVASVKVQVIEDALPHIPRHCVFVPAHPIAGTEYSGPESGFATLFEKRWAIITPLPDTPLRAIEKVTYLWESFGSRIEVMDPVHHDEVLAITSHIPHLIAYTIVGTAADLEDHTKSEVIKFSASGFRDFTRIAASDPVMWRDIFLGNKVAVLNILQRFTEDLNGLQKAIRYGDGEYLESMFTRTRHIRRMITESGQERNQAPPENQRFRS